jgi:hypothetical protein
VLSLPCSVLPYPPPPPLPLFYPARPLPCGKMTIATYPYEL